MSIPALAQEQIAALLQRAATLSDSSAEFSRIQVTLRSTTYDADGYAPYEGPAALRMCAIDDLYRAAWKVMRNTPEYQAVFAAHFAAMIAAVSDGKE